MAAKPMYLKRTAFSVAPETSSAPTIVIPEIAFAPLINGVCKVGGTLDISSNPMKQANTNMKSEKISADIVNSILIMEL